MSKNTVVPGQSPFDMAESQNKPGELGGSLDDYQDRPFPLSQYCNIQVYPGINTGIYARQFSGYHPTSKVRGPVQ